MTRISVAPEEDFASGRRHVVNAEGSEIVVLEWRGAFHAFENVCPHMGGPVAEGKIIGCVKAVIDEQGRYVGERFDDDEPHLICPWHGLEYDLNTGVAIPAPTMKVLKFPVHVQDGVVYVEVQ